MTGTLGGLIESTAAVRISAGIAALFCERRPDVARRGQRLTDRARQFGWWDLSLQRLRKIIEPGLTAGYFPTLFVS